MIFLHGLVPAGRPVAKWREAREAPPARASHDNHFSLGTSCATTPGARGAPPSRMRRALTYGQFDAGRRPAHCAAEAGAGSGGRVVFVIPNSLAWAVVYHGALQAGAVPVPLKLAARRPNSLPSSPTASRRPWCAGRRSSARATVPASMATAWLASRRAW